ncbi:HAD family hydrolase [[Eubacterium] cellulosolvens]
MKLKAVAFDLIGTLVHVMPQRERMIRALKRTLKEKGLVLDEFDRVYEKAITKYRTIRQERLKEVNSCTFITDTLEKIGQQEMKESLICDCVQAYFKPYLDSIMILKGTHDVLTMLKERYSLGVITNFTCSNIVKSSLEKMQLLEFFDHVVVSCEVGWRKPHPKIFQIYLKKTKVKSREAVFIGDDLRRDIFGAQKVGMKAILISAGITPTEDYYYHMQSDVVGIKPDHQIKSLTQLPQALIEIYPLLQ